MVYYADVNAVPGFKEHGNILSKWEKKQNIERQF